MLNNRKIAIPGGIAKNIRGNVAILAGTPLCVTRRFANGITVIGRQSATKGVSVIQAARWLRRNSIKAAKKLANPDIPRTVTAHAKAGEWNEVRLKPYQLENHPCK